jgi:hypothetical protein
MGLLAAAVREYKQHRRQRVAVANLEPRPDMELSEKQIATIQHQAVGINADAPCARQGCCGRTNTSKCHQGKCHQGKCHRRQSGGGGGCCGGKRRPARVPEAAAVYPTAREVETAPFSGQEQGVADDGPAKREGGYLAANRSFGGRFKGNDKEFEAGSVDGHGSRAEQFVELPPYQG